MTRVAVVAIFFPARNRTADEICNGKQENPAFPYISCIPLFSSAIIIHSSCNIHVQFLITF